MQKIPADAYKEVVRNSNLFAFDLIIRNRKDEVLLGMRNNPPGKGYWFVPGGRVYKNEPLNAALARILKQETMIDLSHVGRCTLKGLFEHIYDDNYFEDAAFNTHYIIAACEITLLQDIRIQADEQHQAMKFERIEDLLRDPEVHRFVKYYFMDNPPNRFLPLALGLGHA